jgi:hypothetical protein
MVRMRHPPPAVEHVDLARHEQLRADRHLPLAVEFEEYQFGESGAVGYHRAPWLARISRIFMTHNLDRQRRDFARPGLCDRRPMTTIQVRLGHSEQQVDHPLAIDHLRDQRGHGRTDATQRGQRRKQRCEQVVVHGLTCGYDAAI